MAMMGGGPSAIQSAIAVQVIVVLILLVRAVRMYRGQRFSVARLAVFPFLVMLLFAFTELETDLAVAWAYPVWTVVDVVLVAVAAVATIPFAERIVQVHRQADGGWSYRYGVEIIGIYLSLWVVRLGLALYFDPSSLLFTTPAPGTVLSAGASEALVLIQVLFSVSSGLVIGRSVGAYRVYRTALARVPAGQAPLP